ncbi:hypothetical protein [Methanocella conradii]|uniref:hypothetical protein n=1 Tax=Methanocella conradii TaxID=1175444 RepID=UPI0024B36E45|nr:hypothetical protein [Methanocella conradii]MDI6895824.1 hypothetical protein [Methanocella conradii]
MKNGPLYNGARSRDPLPDFNPPRPPMPALSGPWLAITLNATGRLVGGTVCDVE